MAKATFSPAQECDIVGVQCAARESWRVTYADIFSPEKIASLLRQGYSTDALREAVRAEDSTFLVAAEAGRVVGFGQWGRRADGPELFRLYIMPGYWRRGIGSCLLSLMEQEWRGQDVPRYCCFVHMLNRIGQAFYLGHGFTRDRSKDRDDHWGMFKSLQPNKGSEPPRIQ